MSSTNFYHHHHRRHLLDAGLDILFLFVEIVSLETQLFFVI